MTVLVINSGSSSIKYQLIDPDSGESIATGIVERIGESVGHIKHAYAGKTTEFDAPVPDHGVGLRTVVDVCNKVGPVLSESSVQAIGHRVVQGGKYFSKAALIDDAVEERIRALIPLGPLHNPAHLKGIDVARELFSDIPNVAVFDTAFFQDLPAEASTYALARDVAEKYEIRRYGAHGTSHKYVSTVVTQLLGRDDLKQIVLHLGNGASVSAVVGGKAIDTSMGLTPLEGLVMGTRTGDIDPAAVFHLQREAGMSVDEVDELFNKKSGIKGLTGTADMRDVWDKAAAGDAQAREALDIYAHRIIHYIGAYTAEMGGVDVITFTAGVGENNFPIRALIMERLAPFGVKFDHQANAVRASEPITVSTEDSSVRLMVVPTNEELAIAREAIALVRELS